MNVPYCDLSRENSALRVPLEAAARRVMESGRVLYGAELEAFEHEIAEWHGVKHAVGLGSGTDAIEVALRSTGHDAGEPSNVPAFTAVPTVNAIEAAGRWPDLNDVDPVTRNSPSTSSQCVRVHLYGLMTSQETDEVCVEDCAHSMGALDGRGRMAGTVGRCGALSFYPSKLLGALGDGGAIISNDDKIAERARAIRHYGFNDDRTDVTMRGQNSRLSEMQAAFLRVKLPHVNGWIKRRREIAARYNAELAGRVTVPTDPPGHRHVFHVYVIEHPERDRLKADLFSRGISTMCHYEKSIHQYTRWRHLGEPGQFPVSERLAATVLSIPCYPGLTDQEQSAVIAAIKECT